MSSTEAAWFIPDHEFAQSRMDYGVVATPAPQVCHLTSMKDKENVRRFTDNTTFRDELYFVRHNPCYPYARCGKLLYADVDEESPEHKEHIFGAWAKEELLEKENEETEAAGEALFQHLVDKWGFEDFIEEPLQRYKAVKESFDCDILHRGELDTMITDYILSVPLDDKKILCSILSSQSRRKTPRPVLMLIDVVEDLQKTEAGVTKGWAIGYDLVKLRLIIKPFISKQGHHLFGEIWYGPVAEDGISFFGSLEVFFVNFIELGEAADDKSVNGGFKMLVHTIVAKWMLRQWKGLSDSDPDFYDDERQEKLKNTVTKAKEAMEKITLPIVDKATVDEGVKFMPFQLMYEMMEIQEAAIRHAAILAKNHGNEKVAGNAAKLFGKLKGQLKAFNENPEADV